MKGFWKAYGFGLLAVMAAGAFAAMLGPVAGVCALVLCGGGALALEPVTAGRVTGLLAAVVTPFAVAFASMFAILAGGGGI